MSVPPGPAHDKLAAFVESGGVLLRFAGTRLAAGDDDLTPTALRRGGRTLGGALSWETPKHIAAFDKDEPVLRPRRARRSDGVAPGARRAGAGPRRQDLGAARRRHAAGHRRAARQGPHRALPRHRRHDLVEPADVRPVRRHAAPRSSPAPAPAPGRVERRREGGDEATRAPYRTLDGFGALGAPPAERRADRRRFRRPRRRAPSARLLWPRRRARSGQRAWRRARRSRPPTTAPWRSPPAGSTSPRRSTSSPGCCSPRFLGFLADGLASLWLGRPPRFARPGRRGAASSSARWPARRSSRRRRARPDAPISARDADAARQTHLAYVVTGDATVDETSRLGLETLVAGARRAHLGRRSPSRSRSIRRATN